jgi:hypothetical protein
MISQIPGKGAKYMIAFTDSTGTPLSGGASYRVKLPPNIPAANFLSVTLYEAENASGLDNGQPFPSKGSRDKPVQERTAPPSFISARPRLPAKKPIGSRRLRARVTSRSCGSTGRPKPRSTRVGSRATSRNPSEATTGGIQAIRHAPSAWTAGTTLLTGSQLAHADSVDTRIGKLELQAGYSSKSTAEKLRRNGLPARDAGLHLALPTVGFHALHLAHLRIFGAKDGDVVLYKDF